MDYEELRKKVYDMLESDISIYSAWERNFLKSVAKRRSYSDKQAALIEKLRAKMK